jgi:hypothetical protein
MTAEDFQNYSQAILKSRIEFFSYTLLYENKTGDSLNLTLEFPDLSTLEDIKKMGAEYIKNTRHEDYIFKEYEKIKIS